VQPFIEEKLRLQEYENVFIPKFNDNNSDLLKEKQHVVELFGNVENPYLKFCLQVAECGNKLFFGVQRIFCTNFPKLA